MGAALRLFPRPAIPGLAALVVAAFSLLWWVRAAHSRARVPSAAERVRRPELHAPYAAEPITIDAEEGKTIWQGDSGSTENLRDEHARGMVPYSEVKARWRPDALYLLLYAGDLDIEGTVREPDGPVSNDDSFHIELGGPDRAYVIEVSALGTVADAACRGAASSPIELSNPACDKSWTSQVKVAVDRDGTLNRVGDNDEEWVVEMAIPASALGLGELRAGKRIPFAVRRCEIKHARAPSDCGSWGMRHGQGELILIP